MIILVFYPKLKWGRLINSIKNNPSINLGSCQTLHISHNGTSVSGIHSPLSPTPSRPIILQFVGVWTLSIRRHPSARRSPTATGTNPTKPSNLVGSPDSSNSPLLTREGERVGEEGVVVSVLPQQDNVRPEETPASPRRRTQESARSPVCPRGCRMGHASV